MPDDLHAEINSFLSENREKSPTDIIKEIAGIQLTILGYADYPKRMTDFLKNEGLVPKIDKHLYPGDDDRAKKFMAELAAGMKRIPNQLEAESLLIAATFGTPASENPDGTITISSFSVAEPSTTTVQTKVDRRGKKQFKPDFQTDIKGTDELLRKLISDSGLGGYNESQVAIARLKSSQPQSFTHPSNQSLRIIIQPPTDTKDQNSRTPYSYMVQTSITPSL